MALAVRPVEIDERRLVAEFVDDGRQHDRALIAEQELLQRQHAARRAAHHERHALAGIARMVADEPKRVRRRRDALAGDQLREEPIVAEPVADPDERRKKTRGDNRMYRSTTEDRYVQPFH